jgi:hypothetical protein
MGRHTGLGKLPGGHHAVKMHARRGQVLKNEREWRNMPGSWYGPKLSNVDPQPER